MMKNRWSVRKCSIPHLKRPLLQFAIVSSLLCAIPTADAQTVTENDLKAAIIYNLARFSEWPKSMLPDEETHFRLCVLTGDPMEGKLRVLSGRPIHGRALEVELFTQLSGISRNCHLVFLSEEISEGQDLLAVAQLGILTIGDSEDFLEANGGIAIRRRGEKLGFSINKSVMDVANVSPSSKILRLAVEVH